jgi:hypothetical protein
MRNDSLQTQESRDSRSLKNTILIKSLSIFRNLMAPDNFQNLGLVFKDDQPKGKDATTSTAQAQGTEKKA